MSERLQNKTETVIHEPGPFMNISEDPSGSGVRLYSIITIFRYGSVDILAKALCPGIHYIRHVALDN